MDPLKGNFKSSPIMEAVLISQLTLLPVQLLAKKCHFGDLTFFFKQHICATYLDTALCLSLPELDTRQSLFLSLWSRRFPWMV